MGIHAGNEGSVTLANGGGLDIFAYTFNYGPNLLPSPKYGDEFETAVKGLKACNGTVSAYITSDVAESDPMADIDGSLVLSWAPGCTVTVDVTCGVRQFASSADGLPVVTFPFIKAAGSDAPTVAWDESSSS